jgi:tRNA pseudouridine38-40 synthase
MRYFIKLAYNGSAYHGWQVQNNADTIQEVIEDGMRRIFNKRIPLVGAGRTDAGVHAREFYAHFDYDFVLKEKELQKKTYRLNSFLPKDIIIFDMFQVKDDMHTRFDALSRTYEYIITTRKDPFINDFAWFVFPKLDLDLMNEGASVLLEYNDFTSFAKLHTQVKTNHCNLMEAKWEERNHLLVFTIKADRFLRNMVRAIVGTLVELGQAKIDIDEFRRIIEAKNRSEAGLSVPAQGLYLTSIEYSEDVIGEKAEGKGQKA